MSGSPNAAAHNPTPVIRIGQEHLVDGRLPALTYLKPVGQRSDGAVVYGPTTHDDPKAAAITATDMQPDPTEQQEAP